MNCFEVETGNVAYKGQRIAVGTFSASPLLADGKIYITGEDGTTTILKAGPVFEVLGTAKLDGFTLASPVAVDNQIFIRAGEYLYCIQKH
jgi:outer membrane protein assembly factor BamB